jgi:hypothetical protein
MPKQSTPFVYGQSPAPHSWHETATILKDINKPKKKPSGLLDKLDTIEALLKKSHKE